MSGKLKNVSAFLFMSFAGIIGVIISAYLMTCFLCVISLKNNDLADVLLVWIAMGTGFVVAPILILKKSMI